MRISCGALLWFALSLRLSFGFEVDTSTRGNWHRTYGAEGYMIVEGPEDRKGLSLETTGASRWVWTRGTSDEDALAWIQSRGGIASCWYANDTFTLTVGNNDGRERQFAFYFLDWDTTSRVQKVERLDPVTSAVLEETTLRDFNSGRYLVFSAQGRARLRITRLAGLNAVLSGVFVGGPLAPLIRVQTPTITPAGGTFNEPVQVSLHTETQGATILFTTDGNDPMTWGSIYAGPFTVSADCTVRAVAYKEGMVESAEANASFHFEPPPVDAQFAGRDSETLGAWRGNFGQDGYFTTMFAPVFPAHFWINLSGTARWVWEWPTSSPRGLQLPSQPNTDNRYAACWYTPESMTFSLEFSEEREHTISFYCLDWDRAGRSQKVELVHPASGAVLDTQVLSDFSTGVYLKCRFSDPVLVRVTRLAGPNAVVSGIFLDPPYFERAETPIFSPNGGTFSDEVEVTISTATAGAEIRYTTDGSTPTESSSVYTGPLTLRHSTALTAIAFKPEMQPSAAQSTYFTITSVGGEATARYLGEDRTTQGSWRSTALYGNDGFIIPGDWTIWTNDSSFSFVGGTQHVWAFNRSEAPALEKYSSSGRIAACQYAAERLTMPLYFNGNARRKVSFYFLDWDSNQRSQRIEVIEADTGVVLDSRLIENFHDGLYMSWEVSAPMTFRVTRMAGANAVISGVFMDYIDQPGSP